MHIAPNVAIIVIQPITAKYILSVSNVENVFITPANTAIVAAIANKVFPAEGSIPLFASLSSSAPIIRFIKPKAPPAT